MHIDRERTYSAKQYWAGLAQGIPSTDTSGFAPILHPDAPPWFNRLIDGLQYRGVRRALDLASVHPGARILDVGCGTGRWVRRYLEMGLLPTGVDATPLMLRLAIERGTKAPLVAGEAQRLPFPDKEFDCVSDVTVVQHIPTELQSEAVSEMVRLLKPGGHFILMELIRGEADHIFPRSAQGWIELVSSCGPRLVRWFGEEFLLLDRMFVHAARTIAPNDGRPTRTIQSPQAPSLRQSSFAHGAYWGLRHVTATLSAWIDPVVAKVFRNEMATHGVFVFQK